MRLNFTLFAFFCFLSCLLAPQEAEAQDPRYTQFYAAPLELNPAMMGVYQGQFRVVANYRELYTSILSNHPFRTLSASFDMRQPIRGGDYFAFGLSAMRDEAGTAQFHRVKGNVGGSYLKQLGGPRYATYEQYLVAGAQVGFGQHGLNWQKLWFSQQFNQEEGFIDLNSASGESFDQMTTNLYLDFNAGLLWYVLFDDNSSLYVGGAMHHLNNPNISFLENAQEGLYTRWTAHAGGEIPFSRELSFLPAVAVMGQNTHLSTTAGGNFRYSNREWKEVAIRAGGWGHVSNQMEDGLGLDAFAVTAVLEMERWNIGLSYDITVSSLAAANNSRGAYELSFIYTHPSRWRNNQVNCPKF